MVDLILKKMIQSKIFCIRGKNVIFDRDIAELYGVETKQLKRQVRRNSKRFPPDFMFKLTTDEFKNLRSQFGTSRWGGTRYPPFAFTEQGVAMLSSILQSSKAIKVNIRIIRVFIELRELAQT
ncbi:ORF6N domain-containing protein, partial [Candidatus Dependentiae bacterium]|nr:ORF6N domain-containing protein [Candidatus Dependentiae bacterium]